jgi:hypothetical protein
MKLADASVSMDIFALQSVPDSRRVFHYQKCLLLANPRRKLVFASVFERLCEQTFHVSIFKESEISTQWCASHVIKKASRRETGMMIFMVVYGAEREAKEKKAELELDFS